MLFSIYDEQVNTIWYEKFFNAQRSNLKNGDYEKMIEAMSGIVDSSLENKEKILVASYIPGSDWDDTPWAPIYYDACGRDYDHSAQFFGLLVAQVLMDRSDKWYFIRQEKSALDGKEMRGMTYWKSEK